jgi:hypothetical protein
VITGVNRKTIVLTEGESYAHALKKLKHKNRSTNKQRKKRLPNLKNHTKFELN